MKVTDTISVNPGKTALGHSESKSENIFRTSVINREAKGIDALTLLLPSSVSGINEFKKFALPLRALFATILIVAGLTLLQSVHASALGILEIIFGGLLALGLFTRLAMAGASVYFAIMAALSIRAGRPDLIPLCLMFGTALFCALGSGKYSLDMMLRSLFVRHKKNQEKKRSEKALSYKAFHYARY